MATVCYARPGKVEIDERLLHQITIRPEDRCPDEAFREYKRVKFRGQDKREALNYLPGVN